MGEISDKWLVINCIVSLEAIALLVGFSRSLPYWLYPLMYAVGMELYDRIPGASGRY
jgi:hypothetical protein